MLTIMIQGPWTQFIHSSGLFSMRQLIIVLSDLLRTVEGIVYDDDGRFGQW
jgi:hypothetical protein